MYTARCTILPASAAECRTAVAAERRAPPAIDRFLLPTGRSAANPQHAAAAVDRWHRQTDGRACVQGQ